MIAAQLHQRLGPTSLANYGGEGIPSAMAKKRIEEFLACHLAAHEASGTCGSSGAKMRLGVGILVEVECDARRGLSHYFDIYGFIWAAAFNPIDPPVLNLQLDVAIDLLDAKFLAETVLFHAVRIYVHDAANRQLLVGINWWSA